MLQNQVIIVTGGSQGIGRSIALACARHGAQVVLVARNGAVLNEVVQEIVAQGGKALAVPTDVTDEAQVERMIGQTLERCGRVTGLVNSGRSRAAGADCRDLA